MKLLLSFSVCVFVIATSYFYQNNSLETRDLASTRPKDKINQSVYEVFNQAQQLVSDKNLQKKQIDKKLFKLFSSSIDYKNLAIKALPVQAYRSLSVQDKKEYYKKFKRYFINQAWVNNKDLFTQASFLEKGKIKQVDNSYLISYKVGAGFEDYLDIKISKKHREPLVLEDVAYSKSSLLQSISLDFKTRINKQGLDTFLKQFHSSNF